MHRLIEVFNLKCLIRLTVIRFTSVGAKDFLAAFVYLETGLIDVN